MNNIAPRRERRLDAILRDRRIHAEGTRAYVTALYADGVPVPDIASTLSGLLGETIIPKTVYDWMSRWREEAEAVIPGREEAKA